MDRFFQISAVVLLTVLISIVLSKQNKDMTVVLVIAACCMSLYAVIAYLEPVVDFIKQLQSLGKLDTSMVQTVLKAVGIGIIAEIASLICSDSGNGALGKGIQMLATAAVLWLSLPLMRSLVEIIQKILGDV